MSNDKEYPKHVGIIMDGNRRWAKSKGLEPWKGHEVGQKKFEEMLEWCKEFNIKELSLYTFSMQNFKRTKQEIAVLMNLLKSAATKKILGDSEFNEKNNVIIRFVGRIHLFPEETQKIMKEVMEKTKNNDGYILNFCMGYGGREEILDATKKISEDVASGKIKSEDIDEELFGTYLYLNSDPDLIIRTSGEKRTSNFLTWQSNYSEWAFVDKYWPDFSRDDMLECLEDYAKRDRRKGK